MKRRRGSTRFDTYYKVQWHDAISMTWRDLQVSHQTETAARAAFIIGRTCRVMEITMQGRRPLVHAATFQNSAPGDA